MEQEDSTEAFQRMDPVVFRARRRMEAIGKNPDFGEALAAADSFADVESINDASVRLGLQADYAQLLGFVFDPLYKDDPNSLQEAAKSHLTPVIESCGVHPDAIPEVIAWSLGHATQLPGYAFGNMLEEKYGKVVDKQKKIEFQDALLKFMFDTVQTYLRS